MCEFLVFWLKCLYNIYCKSWLSNRYTALCVLVHSNLSFIFSCCVLDWFFATIFLSVIGVLVSTSVATDTKMSMNWQKLSAVFVRNLYVHTSSHQLLIDNNLLWLEALNRQYQTVHMCMNETMVEVILVHYSFFCLHSDPTGHNVDWHWLHGPRMFFYTSTPACCSLYHCITIHARTKAHVTQYMYFYAFPLSQSSDWHWTKIMNHRSISSLKSVVLFLLL